jgi:hypothetical protein
MEVSKASDAIIMENDETFDSRTTFKPLQVKSLRTPGGKSIDESYIGSEVARKPIFSH